MQKMAGFIVTEASKIIGIFKSSKSVLEKHEHDFEHELEQEFQQEFQHEFLLPLRMKPLCRGVYTP